MTPRQGCMVKSKLEKSVNNEGNFKRLPESIWAVGEKMGKESEGSRRGETEEVISMTLKRGDEVGEQRRKPY